MAQIVRKDNFCILQSPSTKLQGAAQSFFEVGTINTTVVDYCEIMKGKRSSLHSEFRQKMSIWEFN